MAYTTIDDPSEYFQTAIYTGTGSSQTVTNDGNSDLKPDWIWIKCRSNARDHVLLDSTRGGTKALTSNTNGAEATDGAITAFNTDGFTHSGQNAYGGSSETHVAWQWKANGGTTASNTDGDITSTVQANTDAGFSIVTYTGTGSNATIGHGLGVAPKMIIQKNRDESQPWWTYVESIGAGGQLRLNGTNAEGSDGGVLWNSTAPTSSVFSVGDNTGTNGSSDACIAYCFAEKKGYSKFGSYIGNGDGNNTLADGTFVYTGFKPAWVMIKGATVAQGWTIFDNKRDNYNVADKFLYANTSDAETTGYDATDFLSNGFKLRKNLNGTNDSDQTFIYMAFAEHPFVSSEGVPTTAR